MFVEDGTEDLIISPLLNSHATAPRLSRLVSKVYHHLEEHEMDLSAGHRLLELAEADEDERSYSLLALYYLSINYILGVGCLGIPFAFARAGFLLCSSILIIVTIFSYMTVMWVAETGARFERQLRSVSEDLSGQASEASSLVRKKFHADIDSLEDGRYEVIDLVNFYLGPVQKTVYQISLMSLMYVGLLAYSQVFCGAIGALFWGSSRADQPWNAFPQLVFGIMVVPLSCMELDEQVTIQSIMATVRFMAIFVMVFGSTLALFMDSSKSHKENPPFWASEEPIGCQMSYTVCFSGFGVAFSTSLFSQLFQHSIPGLLRPLRTKPQQLTQVPVSILQKKNGLS